MEREGERWERGTEREREGDGREGQRERERKRDRERQRQREQFLQKFNCTQAQHPHPHLPDDIRRLQFSNGTYVLLNGPIVVTFGIQVVAILREDGHQTILVELLALCQAATE